MENSIHGNNQAFDSSKPFKSFLPQNRSTDLASFSIDSKSPAFTPHLPAHTKVANSLLSDKATYSIVNNTFDIDTAVKDILVTLNNVSAMDNVWWDGASKKLIKHMLSVPDNHKNEFTTVLSRLTHNTLSNQSVYGAIIDSIEGSDRDTYIKKYGDSTNAIKPDVIKPFLSTGVTSTFSQIKEKTLDLFNHPEKKLDNIGNAINIAGNYLRGYSLPSMAFMDFPGTLAAQARVDQFARNTYGEMNNTYQNYKNLGLENEYFSGVLSGTVITSIAGLGTVQAVKITTKIPKNPINAASSGSTAMSILQHPLTLAGKKLGKYIPMPLLAPTFAIVPDGDIFGNFSTKLEELPVISRNDLYHRHMGLGHWKIAYPMYNTINPASNIEQRSLSPHVVALVSERRGDGDGYSAEDRLALIAKEKHILNRAGETGIDIIEIHGFFTVKEVGILLDTYPGVFMQKGWGHSRDFHSNLTNQRLKTITIDTVKRMEVMIKQFKEGDYWAKDTQIVLTLNNKGTFATPKLTDIMGFGRG